MAKVTAEKILLGCGVFAVDGVPVGLTRGGGSFLVERETRPINADCDKGMVKGRISLDTETPKLKMRLLEMFDKDELTDYFPATSVTSSESSATWEPTLLIADTDYHTVTWTGKTKDGKSAVITVQNAINLGNLELAMEEKNEVVPEIEYTGTYTDDTAQSTQKIWSVVFAL